MFLAKRKQRSFRAPSLQQMIEALESRVLLAGGGFTASGLSGEYFANNSLSGTPTFVRQDVRVDFDWGNAKPGGSVAAPYSNVPADHFSVRWTGQFVPEFGEAYTFYATTDDGVRLFYKPTSTSTWTTLIDFWQPQAATERSGTTAVLAAGQTYDIRMEYQELTGGAVAKLWWSSARTPKSVVDPLRMISTGLSGLGDSAVDEVFVDVWKTNRGYQAPAGGGTAPAVDANNWPMGDFQTIMWDGAFLTGNQSGTYKLTFTGQADVTLRLVAGSATRTGYDAATNTTTYDIVITSTTGGSPWLNFINTRRTAGSALGTGVTNIQMLRPGYTAQNTFTTPIKNLIKKYSVMRFMDWLETNHNETSNWADRTLVSQNQKREFGEHGAGAAWEYIVQLANETGKDIWIDVPALASGDVDNNGNPTSTSSYIYKLAQLLRYGSDGVNPYTSVQANPVYPPLNSNLRVYVEYSNEVWNFLFDQGDHNRDAAIAEAAAGAAIGYDGTGDTFLLARRRVAERAKDISEIFRSVWGSSQMMSKIRPVFEWQYDNANNTASDGLEFLNNYYNNGDGVHVSTPRPPSYYLYGGGLATYFGSGNSQGDQSTFVFGNSGFESPVVASGQFVQAPASSSWTWSGTAGIAANGSSLGNPNAPVGAQAGYVRGTGYMQQTINFTQTGVYGLFFRSAMSAGAASGKGIQLLVDGVAVGDVMRPGTGYGSRNTLDFRINTTGNHTIRLAATDATVTAFIDDVQIKSVNAIFAAGIPSSGWQNDLNIASNWAAAYGLKHTAYEGGWSLVDNGGQGFTLTPVQAAAREDSRAQAAAVSSFNIFALSGGEIYNDFGTGARRLHPWGRTDNIDNLNTPLLRAVDQATGQLPPNPNNATTIPATLNATATSINYRGSLSGAAVALERGEWLSWNIWVNSAGQYNIGVDASGGGTLQLMIDGVQVDQFNSADALTRARTNVTLSRGVHTVRVRNNSATASSFSVKSATVLAGVGASTGPALGTMELAGAAGDEVSAAFDSVAPGVAISAVTRGPGLNPGNPGVGSGGYLSIPVGNQWGADLNASISMNQYLTFTVDPAAGQTMSLSRLDLAMYNQNNRPTFGAGLRYSTDGTNFTTIPMSGPSTAYVATLSSIAALQNTTATITFRIYMFGSSSFESDGIGRASGNDMVISGSLVQTAQTPAAPTNLDAVRNSSQPTSRIDLTWTDNSSNETGFKIQRATESAFTANLANFTVGANVTSFASTGLAPWTVYYYRVAATNSAGDSAWSNTDNVQTLGVPSDPTNLTASAVSTSQINLAWSDNSGAETGYRVERSTDGVTFSTLISLGSNATSYQNTGLDSSTRYWYRVFAFNAQGDSQPTNTANARTADGANGLRGEYYDNSDLTSLKLTRTDGTVNFVWWDGSPDPLVGADTFSVRWTGQVEAQFSETYTFYTSTDDGVRLWVNGVQLVNDWVNHAETERSGTIALVAGQRYNIKMEYYEAAGGAAAKLLWSSASTAKAAIPNNRLFPSMNLSASADAFVRDGSHANTNNGSATTLDVKTSTSGFTRYSYLTFDLTQLGSIGSAKLRLFGGLNGADSLNISIFDVSDTSWGEGTLTYNNRPANGTTALATTTINSTTPQWWEWDLTSYLQQQQALGRTSVSLLLKSDFSTTAAAVATFNSDEALTDRPGLVVMA